MINQEEYVLELKKDLWRRQLEKFEFLEEEHQEILYDALNIINSNIPFLYEIHDAISTSKDYLAKDDNQIIFQFDEVNCFLTINNSLIKLGKLEMKQLIDTMIDIFEDILPLGTVVTLKEEYIRNDRAPGPVKLVIANRFLRVKDTNAYFQYAGVFYPFGMFGQDQMINFTSALIDKVVHYGYCDQNELSYVFMLKNESILQRQLHSYGFATEEEMDILERISETEEISIE